MRDWLPGGSLTIRSGDRDVFQQGGDHIVGGLLLRFRFVAQDDSVPEHLVGDVLHVLGKDVATSRKECIRSRGQGQCDGRSGRCAEVDQSFDGNTMSRRISGRDHEFDDVLLDPVIEVDPVDV